MTNRYDRVGSSQDFSNNEGFHNYQDRTDRDFRNPPHFSESRKSQFDDGMARSEQYDRQRYPSQDWQRPARDYTGRFDQEYATRRALEDQDGPRSTRRFDSSSSESPSQYKPQRQSSWSPDYSRNERPFNYDSSRFEPSESFRNDQARGKYYGKGPKNYKRSDERIYDDVCETLAQHPEIDASEVEVDVKSGLVTLSGTVSSRQIKRMTEDSIEHLPGVIDVKNDLRVMASIEDVGNSTRLSSTESSTFETPSDLKSKNSTKMQPGSKNSQGTAANKTVQ
jgi:hypothetical protein